MVNALVPIFPGILASFSISGIYGYNAVGSLIGSIIGVIIIKAANECFKSCDIEMLELYKRAKKEDVFLAWELAKNLFFVKEYYREYDIGE